MKRRYVVTQALALAATCGVILLRTAVAADADLLAVALAYAL